MSLKKTILRDILKLSTSGYCSRIFLFLRGIINAKFMGPSNYGIWRGVNIFSNYSLHAHIGVLNGMILEIPVCYGKYDYNRIDKIRNTTFTFMLLIILFIGIISFIGASYFQDPLIVNVVKIMSFIIVLQFIKTYFSSLFGIDMRFDFLSKFLFLQSLVNLVLSYFLVKAFNIYGALATNILLLVFGILLMNIYSNYKVKIAIDYDILLYLIKIGSPILLPMIMKQGLDTVDKILIIKLLGKTVFGYYSITMMASMVVMFMPSIVIATIQPRLYEKYGQTGSLESVKKYVLKPLFISGYLFPLFTGVVYICFPILIKLFLKDYIQGIDAVKIILIGLSFSSLTFIPVSLLNVLNKQNKLLIFFALGIVFNLIFNYLFILFGFGIEGVALVTSIINFLLSIAIISFALKFYLKELREQIIYIFELFLPSILLFFILYFIDYASFGVLSGHPQAYNIILKSIFVLFLSFIYFYLCNLRTDIFKDIKDIKI